jgi:hypothetical protein
VTRSRKARWAALLLVAAVAVGSSLIGGAFSAFSGQTAATGNVIAAMSDFRGPTVSPLAIGKSAGGATGRLGSGRSYYVYANVSDVGTPPSGTATVTANVSSITSGLTVAPLTAGSYTAGGVQFNYRSASLTANAGLPAGLSAFSVTATDALANATTANGTVTIDNTAPSPTNISAAGGVAGRPEVGDVLTLTTNESLEPMSVLAGWSGGATAVQVRFRNLPPGDRLEIWDAAASSQLPFGTISLGRTDFTTSNLWFEGSTMTQAGNAITISLGGPVTGTVTTVGGTGTMVWTPSATVLDLAGNPLSTAAFNEPAPLDRDF